MKYLILVSLLSLSVAAEAKQGRPFNCVTSSGHGDMVSISGCASSDGHQLMACKGQDRTLLGAAYLTLEKVQFKSGRVISAPVIQKVLIPSQYVAVKIDADAFEIKMRNEDVGMLDVRMPRDPMAPNGKNNGRYFSTETNGIRADHESVVCQYRK